MSASVLNESFGCKGRAALDVPFGMRNYGNYLVIAALAGRNIEILHSYYSPTHQAR
jgi:hypothetical protein